MKNKVGLLLFFTLLIMSFLPLGAGIYLMKNALVSQEQIYKSPKLENVLDSVQGQLKLLSKLNPQNEANYRSLFQQVQDVKLIYGSDGFLSDHLRVTFSKYFLYGFGLSIFASLLLGFFLSTIINKVYKKSYDDLEKTRKEAGYLEEIARWQEIAQQLAHELRRPLQPIGIWISNLKTSYKEDGSKNFEPLLLEASSMIEEELSYLKNMIDEFARFANVPKANRKSVNISNFLHEFVDQYGPLWDNVSFSLDTQSTMHSSCLLDTMLFKQALTNMLENAVEANPNEKVNVVLSLKNEEQFIALDFFNRGKILTQDQQNKVFDLYFSTKNSTKNMGLGMSIVKFAVLEHAGTIRCIDDPEGVRFRIQLPLLIQGVKDASQ